MIGRISLEELKDSYKGAMYRVVDTVFLLDPSQVYSIYKALNSVKVTAVEEPTERTNVGCKDEFYYYWLRTPHNDISNANYPNESISLQVFRPSGNIYSSYTSMAECGVRPAFYLNESTAKIKSGSGTETDPYILDGTPQEGITVFSNGKQVDFDQQPFIENDRTLVGMRAVFESLGADVVWNGEDKTVTAVKDDTTIQLQIDNNKMQVNNDTVELEIPARLINDNAMVPIRAVSEALEARVEWVDDLQRVVVDEQPEWVESDWNPAWYQQAMIAGGYIK